VQFNLKIVLFLIDLKLKNKNPLYGSQKNVQDDFTEYALPSTKENPSTLKKMLREDYHDNVNKIAHSSIYNVKSSSRKYPIFKEAKYTVQQFVSNKNIISSTNKSPTVLSSTTMSSK